MREDLENIIRLSTQTSFRKKDLLILKNLYSKYINNNHNICMQCPGSINHMINVFKAHTERLIAKLTIALSLEKETKEDGE